MLQHGDMPVQKLQHEVVDALQAAAGGRVGRIARQFLELVVDPADHAIGPAVDDRMRAAQQHRRHVFFIEHDLPVADFEDARDAEADVAGLGGLAKFETEPRKRDIDFFLDAQRRRSNR